MLQTLLKDRDSDYDEATIAFCEKAAEHGILGAQLLLGRIASLGKAGGRDLVQSYVWFCVALDQITRSKNNVKRSMTPEQQAEAGRRAEEQLRKSRRAGPHLSHQHLPDTKAV